MQRSWLSPVDGTECDVSPEGTTRFEATCLIPSNTPKGIYKFSVDVANVTDPARGLHVRRLGGGQLVRAESC